METILDQTIKDWELIVCDSYSDDGTWKYFQKFKRDPRVKLYQVPREGLYAGWNECLRRVTGEYVYIATADDTCSPILLEKMAGALDKTKEEVRGQGTEDRRQLSGNSLCAAIAGAADIPNIPSFRPADIAMCQFDFIDEKGSKIEPAPRHIPSDFFGEWNRIPHRRSGEIDLLVHLSLGVSWTTITSILFRRSLLGNAGLFRTDCGAFADRFWAFKTALTSDIIAIPDSLATWRFHPGQRSSLIDMMLSKRLWKETETTIAEIEDKLPQRWRQDKKWRDKLLFGSRHDYYERYHLDRLSLKRSVGIFCRGLLAALHHEPLYVVKRIVSGLPWDETYRDSRKLLLEMIKEWNVPWPPQRSCDKTFES